MTTEPTMSDRVTEYGITMKITSGPDYQRDADGWEHNAYRITLRRKAEGRTIRTPWRAGLGITGAPTVAEVLDSLVSDAATFEQSAGFEDFAADMGYDSDSRKAFAIWHKLEKLYPRVVAFLGDSEDFRVLAYETERQ